MKWDTDNHFTVPWNYNSVLQAVWPVGLTIHLSGAVRIFRVKEQHLQFKYLVPLPSSLFWNYFIWLFLATLLTVSRQQEFRPSQIDDS